MKQIILSVLACLALVNCDLGAHCQMPCGIYHDDMVFDQVDQYVETMYKGMSILNSSKFHGVHDWNEVIRWVMLKEKESDSVTNLLTTYFLQQKIKPGETDTAKRLVSCHKLLFLLVGIKQNTSIKFVQEFLEEWEIFKSMFHVEGYECQIELLKQQKREAEAKEKAKEKAEEKAEEKAKMKAGEKAN
jgi:nickel superoxide dismutase